MARMPTSAAVLLLVTIGLACPGRAALPAGIDLGFEDVSRAGTPTQWTTSTQYPFDTVAAVLRDPRYVRSGEASVKLAKTPDPARPEARGHVYTREEIPVRPGERYTLTLWARGTGHLGADVYAYGPRNGGPVGFIASLGCRALEGNPAAGAVTDDDWQCYRYEVDLRQADAALSAVRLVIVAVGTVYVDDLAWTRTPEQPAVPAESAAPPTPEAEACRTDLVTLPLAQAAPRVDGEFQAAEYSVTAAGLVSQATHELYERPAQFGFARTADRLYFGLALDLPVPSSLTPAARTRDDRALIAARDTFYLVLRADAGADDSTYAGVYLAVAPDGVLYDAWEEVSWSKGYCRRDESFNADWQVATRRREGTWVIELSVPFADLRLPPPPAAWQLSFGMNLAAGAVAWQPHPNWFDHPQAFGRLHFADGALAVHQATLGALARGEVQPSFEFANPGATGVPYDATYLVSTPKLVAGRVGSYIFDVALDVREKAVIRDRSVYYWNRMGELAVGETRAEHDTGALAAPGSYVLETEVRAGGTPLFYRKLPFAFVPPISAALTPIPSRDEIRIDLSLRGARPEERGQVRVRFLDKDGTPRLAAEAPADSEDAPLRLSMAALPAGDYRVEFSLLDREGKTTATTALPFSKWPLPPWLQEPVGLEALAPDWVPDPWVPVSVEAGSIGVWGRQFDVAAGSLLAGLSSQGEALLAAGVSVHYVVGETPYELALAAPRITALGRGRAQVEQHGTSPHLEASARQQIEFDGMDRIELRLQPRQPVTLARAWIEIPFRDLPYSILMANEGAGSQYWQRGLAADRLFATPRAFSVVWLGDDRAGCAFFTENYRGWIVDSSRPRVTLNSVEGRRCLRLDLVNTPAAVERPIEVTFGLQPSPFKPLFRGWRNLRPQGLAIEPPPVNAAFVSASFWNSCDSKPSPRTWQTLADIVAFAHGRQQKAFPYLGTFFISPYDNVRRETPFDPAQGRYAESQLLRRKAEATRQEEFFYFAADWQVQPPQVNEAEWETRQEVRTAAGSSWADYVVYGIAEMLRRTDVDGFYLDIANPIYDLNEARGLTVTTADGKREGSVELFAARDLYKRLYRVFEQYRGPARRPWLFGHGFAVAVPYSPFWDVNFNCEEVKPNQPFEFSAMNLQQSLEGTPLARCEDAAGARSYDAFAFRAHFGEQFGLANVVLPQYGYLPELNTVAHSREMLAWTFPHGNLLWPAYVPSGPVYEFWSKVEVPFGLGEAEFHPYWRNGIVTVPESVRVSYWSKPRGDDSLLAAANWSGERVVATIALPAALRRGATVVDAESQETLATAAALSVPIPAHDLRVFRIRAAEPERN